MFRSAHYMDAAPTKRPKIQLKIEESHRSENRNRNGRKHGSLYASGRSLYLPQGSVVVGACSGLQTLRTIPAGAGNCHCEESLRHSLGFTPAVAGNMALAADITAAAVCWLSRQGDPTTFFHLVLKNPLTRQIRWSTQIIPRFLCRGRNLRPQSKDALQAPPPEHQANLRRQLKNRGLAEWIWQPIGVTISFSSVHASYGAESDQENSAGFPSGSCARFHPPPRPGARPPDARRSTGSPSRCTRRSCWSSCAPESCSRDLPAPAYSRRYRWPRHHGSGETAMPRCFFVTLRMAAVIVPQRAGPPSRTIQR